MLLRYRYRIYLLGLLVIACFSMLLLRLWSIQIVRGDEFKARVPALRARGLSEAQVQTVLVDNPGRAFAVGIRRLGASGGR